MPDSPYIEFPTRTHMRGGDIVLAVVASSAGTLVCTTGVSVTLIGVMVAVTLLPPVITIGLMLAGASVSAIHPPTDLYGTSDPALRRRFHWKTHESCGNDDPLTRVVLATGGISLASISRNDR